jgi:nucleotide-binding universal stress UspA family protein
VTGPFARVAVCIDHSPADDRGIAAVTRLAPRRIDLVHVAPPGAVAGYSRWGVDRQLAHRRAEEWLDGRAAAVPGAVPVLLWGDPADVLIAWAAREEPDLMVLASHPGPIDRLLGGVTRRLVVDAPCPVLVVPPGCPDGAGSGARPGAGFAHIACCVDPSASSVRAARLARRVADAGGPCRISLVHAVDDGTPDAEILAWAETAAPDLIVAAAHDGPLERARHGSVAWRLARHARCPVLVTR